MAYFGWIAPASSLQAGREAGKICWSGVDVGERWSTEKPWKVWVFEELVLGCIQCRPSQT